jgi:dihydroflavonol-4-reductase
MSAEGLNADAGQLRLRAPCRFALPSTVPKDENELIVPARDGALRLLRAARDARVKRVM